MEEMERYRGQRVVQSVIPYAGFDRTGDENHCGLFEIILRRWRIVLLTLVLISAIGIPAVWFNVKPAYQASAAINVAPVIPSILFGDGEGVPMYKNFMYTQADLLTSDRVLQRVADDLADKDIGFLKNQEPQGLIEKLQSKFDGEKPSGISYAIRTLVANGGLTVRPEDKTQLIKISMTGANPYEAAQVVDAFVRAYMAVITAEEAKGGDHKLSVLEDKRRTLTEKIKRERQTIRDLAEEYGTDSLTERHRIMLDRVAALQTELTKFQMKKITLQIQEKLLENNNALRATGEDTLRFRHDFINTDLMIRTLTANTAQLEQDLVIAGQILAPTNPELERKRKLLETVKQHLAARREEISADFDEIITREAAKAEKDKIGSVKTELEQIEIYERHLTDLLAQEDSETIELGRKQLAIQEFGEQLETTRQLYDTVQRRIQELEMERKRPARISVAYMANISPVPSKRKQYAAAVVFIAGGLGVLLALLKEKLDMKLHTPDDITRRVGARVIGTVTRPADVRKAFLPQQVADDYQTICANLGLFSGEGIPRKIVVTSPGPREGKTTLSINLASSLGASGRKVLLVDGDLRKPDIARMLKLQYPRDGLKELLFGKDFKEVVSVGIIPGVSVLTADPCKPAVIYELITQAGTFEFINTICNEYDHVIIDSPPALAAPDALLWAKMTDAVVLASIAGRTESLELKHTLERLAQIGVRVLGTILSNVPANHNYNRYGYGHGYGVSGASSTGRTGGGGRAILLPMQK